MLSSSRWSVLANTFLSALYFFNFSSIALIWFLYSFELISSFLAYFKFWNSLVSLSSLVVTAFMQFCLLWMFVWILQSFKVPFISSSYSLQAWISVKMLVMLFF